MTNQVAATDNRRRIPDRWLMEFDGMTNAEMAWFSDNADDTEVRAWCGWELEYREAFRVEVYIDAKTGDLKRKRG